MVSEDPGGGQELLVRARDAYRRGAWGDVYTMLSTADQRSPVGTADLALLATAAYLLGLDEVGDDLSAREYRELVRQGDWAAAARCAAWLGIGLLLRAEVARSGGWLARARELLDEGRPDCVAQGYLLMPVGWQSLEEGDSAQAHTIFRAVTEIGARFSDPDLMAFGRLGIGRLLPGSEKPRAGLRPWTRQWLRSRQERSLRSPPESRTAP